jgi:hypothetical protein
MKRRTFIISASVVAVGLPAAYYLQKHKWKGDPLNTPEFLSQFCDTKQLKDIGSKYIGLVPAENKKAKLTDLILTDAGGVKLKSSDKIEIAEFIDKKIHEEFSAYNIMVINGWVISITEARQCALFSLT